MALFSDFTRWTDYLSVNVAVAEIDERAAETVLKKAEATVILRDWGGTKDDKVTIARAQRDTDQEVIEARGEYERAHAYRKLVTVLYERCERDSAALSRELTRRVGREPMERRDRRWTP